MTQPIQEHRIHITKTARYYTVGEITDRTNEAWLACHGYGQLAERFAARFDSIASAERCVVAPEGLHRFYLDPIDRSASERRVGATWMTREAREDDIADYNAYLDQVCDSALGSARADLELVGFGFSQGTSTIVRWAVATARRLSQLVLWGSGLPPDLDWTRAEERLRKVPVTLVAGRRDPFAQAERITEQESLLRDHGITYETIFFDGDHRVDSAVLSRIVER